MTFDGEQLLVGARNKQVMRIIDKELARRKKGKLALFYGVGHDPDFHKRLVARGYKQVSKTWRTAWNIGLAAPQVERKSTTKKPEQHKPARPPKKKAPKCGCHHE